MAEVRTFRDAPSVPPQAENPRPLARQEWLSTVPAEVRGRIRSGMRWTVWLSALAVPFSYGTSVVLARTSPETIGAFGLLTVYVGLVSSVLYLGGDAVAFKFLPEMDGSYRVSFLFSYFVVICASMTPWLLLAVLFPNALHYLFGREAGAGFLLSALCLAPVLIFFSLIRAVLKAHLDFRRAQLLARTVTIGSFVAYGFLFLFHRQWFSLHSTETIWSVYLLLTALGIVVGVHWLRKGPFLGNPRVGRRVRFWLPRGFWAYTLGTEQVSVLGFFLQRLDYILVLNFGGLKLLGEYVAITTLALSVPLVTSFFYDTLLPSLTNLLAAGDARAAGEVFRAHMRLFLLIIAGGTCGLIFLASPLLAIFGPAYESLGLPVLVLSALVGLAGPGGTGATLLSAIGKPQRAVWANLLVVGAFVGLFFAFWPGLGLLGAALAFGLSTFVGSVLVFVIGTKSAHFHTGVGGDYARMGAVVLAAALVAWHWQIRTLLVGLLGWGSSILLFLAIGRYSRADCRDLWRWVVPGRVPCRVNSGAQLSEGGG